MNDRPVVLVLNAGSSSLKFSVYRISDGAAWQPEARGQIEGIGTSPRFSARTAAGTSLDDQALDATGPRRAARRSSSWPPGFARAFMGRACSASAIASSTAVRGYAAPMVVTPAVMDELRALVPLAPLHQPHNLAAIDAVSERLPGVPQVACFDTSFHRGHEAVADVVPLPGASGRPACSATDSTGCRTNTSRRCCRRWHRRSPTKRVIVAHLGSGASLCALKNGRSVDSSFGFTALDGLCMGTRPGALDPGVVLYLFQGLGLSAQEVETVLYKESGLLGISGISNDMRDLLASREPAARLAVDYFVYRAAKEIGALAAVLRGIDGLVFTAGIGENSRRSASGSARRRRGSASSWIGEANAQRKAADLVAARVVCRRGWSRPTRN